MPALFLAFGGTLNGAALASQEPGLTVTVYNNFGYNGSPPLPAVSGRPVAGETTVSRVEQDFDQSPPFGLYEDFIVRYEGYVTSPVSGSFRFWPQADDGTQLYIDDIRVQNDWRDKGGGGAFSSYVDFEAGVSKKFEMWFYENGGGAWTTLYWDINGGWEVVPDSAFTKQVVPTTTTTTTVAPYLNAPQNLEVTSTNESKVYLSWDAPEQSNTEVERYAVFYSCDNWSSGFGIASLTTSAVVEGLDPEQSCQFKVRADNDSIPTYSGWSNEVNGVTLPTTTTTSTTTTTTTTSTIVEQEVPEWTTTTVLTPPATVTPNEPVDETPPSASYPEGDGPAASIPQYAPEQETTTQTDEPPIVVPEQVQDTADIAVEDIFDGPMSNAGIANAVDDLIADAETPTQLTAVVNSLLDQELSDTQFATVIESVFDGPMSNENFAAAVDAVFEDPTKLSDAQFEDAVTAVFDGPLSNAQFEDAVETVFEDTNSLSNEQFDAAVQAVFDEPLTTEQFSEALDAVFDEPLTDEKFDAIVDAVLDAPLSGEQFEELVGVLESDTVTEEQVAAAVDSVIENGVTEEQATDLATSEKVLESIDGDQATEIFDAVDIGAVTPEEAAQLVEAVQEAPTEVREAMESEINVFQGAIDTYIPLGSSVPVGTRRVIIGASALAIFCAPVPVSRRS